MNRDRMHHQQPAFLHSERVFVDTEVQEGRKASEEGCLGWTRQALSNRQRTSEGAGGREPHRGANI